MMKKLLVLLFSMLLLAGCAEKASATYTVVTSHGEFTVDQAQQTISDGTHIYKFEMSGTGRTEVRIIYPNGSTFWRSYDSEYSYSGGWSEDYDENAYVPGDVLLDLLERDAPSSGKKGNPLLGIFLIAIGLWHVLAPQSAWYLSKGWYYKDAEPSEAALGMYRIGGVLAVLFGLGATFL